ncbi:hypothetical protein J2W56_006712 [Nocardia kruczakiae]|uniref:Uncharacterized protein n=1 Tax=Nocardia kruczakiae TaxID=261477 RepID=A0ABU1XSD7_9NOCA|nr:hypothetical protein [Nocardia kruczakiae]
MVFGDSPVMTVAPAAESENGPPSHCQRPGPKYL